MKIKYDFKLMKSIALFENITRAHVKDCIDSSHSLIFVVQPMQLSKAIGKQGANVKKLELKFKKKIKIIEYHEDPTKFLKNIVAPAKVEVTQEENKLIMEAADHPTRGILIGRNASHLRSTEEIVKRFFPIEEVIVK